MSNSVPVLNAPPPPQRTELEYDYRDTGAWWLDKLARQIEIYEPVVYAQAPQPAPEDNPRMRVVTEFQWHGADSPGARLPAQVTVQPGHPDQEQRTTYAYDAHGNADGAPGANATAPGPSENGQQGQGVTSADSGPAVDQQRPGGEVVNDPVGQVAAWASSPTRWLGSRLAGLARALSSKLGSLTSSIGRSARGGIRAGSRTANVRWTPASNAGRVVSRADSSAGGGSVGGTVGSSAWTKVSRWMSTEEATLWRGRSSIPQPRGKMTQVTRQGAPRPGAASDMVRVDFEVPTHSLQPGGTANWFNIFNEARLVPIREPRITLQ